MMSVPIPQAFIKKIQHCQRSFIWGDSLEKKHLHYIRWCILTKDKRFGGLGLRNLPIMNKACLAKLGWKLKTNNTSLWCRLMKSKYISRYLNSGSFIAKASDSYMWKMIVDLRPKLDSMSYWEVGNNLTIRMWDGAWVSPGVFLKDLANTHLDSNRRLPLMENLLNADGTWNWTLISKISPLTFLIRFVLFPLLLHLLLFLTAAFGVV